MMRKAWHAIWLVLIAVAMLDAPIAGASAQSYPNGQIKILVGFPPGGTTDIIARDVGQELEKAWHQTVIVENRAGANGALAAAQLAKLPPDGQTLMMIVSGHITNPLVSPSAGYDALKDFTNISLLASSPLLIFAHPSFASQRHQGRDRACQGKAQHHRLRDAGRGLDPAAFDGAAVLSQRRQVSPRALSRRRAGAERHHRRPCADQRAERVPGAAA